MTGDALAAWRSMSFRTRGALTVRGSAWRKCLTKIIVRSPHFEKISRQCLEIYICQQRLLGDGLADFVALGAISG